LRAYLPIKFLLSRHKYLPSVADNKAGFFIIIGVVHFSLGAFMENLLTFLKMSILGGVTGWFMFKVLKMHTFGHLWGAIITGIIGAYISHLLLRGALGFIPLVLGINIVAALIGAIFLVWLLSKVSPS
jgi:uncharacterized membrane protein YeaQ/YmgE (transglycosylase-associated protein family)